MNKSSFLGLFLLLMNTGSYAESTVHTNQQAKSTSTTATVKFVIRIPQKLALTSTNGKVTFDSNTGNLLTINHRTNSNTFISKTKFIQLQQNRQDTYTVASP
ncbi:MAG: Unknown protein [uncultured Thiotrichaceae bacterium]|uniref:DUF4968 domain-containing protein n=1 Tax=uncultured Thiotrichaceae bacterium TaxID=298394 RepID=A0A6S6T0J5_9GAMM|nr:MAG: Unknown protein [uncultured Thiotrichaceae bacterium]